MKILITGACGFIGFNLANSFLKEKNKIQIIGIDNFDNYYTVKLKKKRLRILKKYKKFKFHKLDITKKLNIERLFKRYRFDNIIHLAAQAGVRYSLIDPKKYIDANLIGYLNIINQLSKNKVKSIFYASSSSVYGDNNNFPLKENEKLNPKNIYGVSKKLNEIIADYYSKKIKTKFIGMRFFTIYGEWGRPDMFFLKLFKSALSKNVFYLNNYGNHDRDFTYIGDIYNLINILIKKTKKKHTVYNFSSNKPINISNLVNRVKKNHLFKVKLAPLHIADIIKTHGSNRKILKKTKYKYFMDINKGFDITFDWYKKNNIHKIK